MGRQSKLNAKLIDELCEWIEDDVPFKLCAEGCGITYISFNNWMKKGEEDFNKDIDSIEAELFYRIKKSYAETVRKSVAKIKSGDKNWQGECWIRQRRDNEFMDKQSIETSDEKVIVQLGNIKGRHIKKDDNIE